MSRICIVYGYIKALYCIILNDRRQGKITGQIEIDNVS